MKKIALTIAALSLTAGAAFAENPNVGRSDIVQSGPNAGASLVDGLSTASIGGRASAGPPGLVDYIDPTANRYGDAAPGN